MFLPSVALNRQSWRQQAKLCTDHGVASAALLRIIPSFPVPVPVPVPVPGLGARSLGISRLHHAGLSLTQLSQN